MSADFRRELRYTRGERLASGHMLFETEPARSHKIPGFPGIPIFLDNNTKNLSFLLLGPL